MMWLKNKIRNLKFALGCRWVTSEGFAVVQMVERAGTEYLVANDGSLLRIGGKVKVRK
ncbi:hypothetical protein [Uliginosibacterium sp. 31-12]|uniref:hypothetical protein n=1 Tax=Uliginosibacterium sp. 31-12 TaxID=3062781 RepID=UPI0026E1A284|nr:hypothetical protein [Uliginosibacterium sp. 31-12]MDO6385598.1 hypothetical protein [Uliginosibacterium sp. 31-12]